MDAPLAVDLRMAGLVEAWASGVAWEEVRAWAGLGWAALAWPAAVCCAALTPAAPAPPRRPLVQVMADCSLDDGDVARLLTRTVDLLRQVGFCDTLLPQLRRAARQAGAAMDRAPISDLVT